MEISTDQQLDLHCLSGSFGGTDNGILGRTEDLPGLSISSLLDDSEYES